MTVETTTTQTTKCDRAGCDLEQTETLPLNDKIIRIWATLKLSDNNDCRTHGTIHLCDPCKNKFMREFLGREAYC